MPTSPAVGLHQAKQVVIAQAIVAVLAALAFLPAGGATMLAVALGVVAVMLGGVAAAYLAFGGGIAPAGAVLMRLILAMLLKWACIAAVLVMGLAVWRVPPLGLIAGLVIGLVTQAWIAARR